MKWMAFVVTTLTLVGWAPAAFTAEYHVQPLQPVDPCAVVPAVGWALNDLGQVAAHGYVPGEGATARAHACLVDAAAGHYIALPNMNGVLDPCTGGNGYNLNNRGWMVGRNEDSAANYHGFLFIDDNGNGACDPGELRDLGLTAPYTSGVSEAVNEAGTVVGIDSYWTDVRHSDGWIWKDANGNLQLDAGEKHFIGDYLPTDINNDGAVSVNYLYDATVWYDDDQDAVIDAGEVTVLPNPIGGPETQTKKINHVGQVAGRAETAFGTGFGYLWTDANQDRVAQAEEFETFGDYIKETHLRGLNDRGQIVGGTYAYYLPYRQAFVWDSVNGMRNLNGLIEPYTEPGHGPLILSQAEDINNKGQIVATGWLDDDGDEKRDAAEPELTVVLTPIITGDLDIDADCDLVDFGIMSACYGCTDCSGACAVADLVVDGAVDFQDVAELATQWLTGALAY